MVIGKWSVWTLGSGSTISRIPFTSSLCKSTNCDVRLIHLKTIRLRSNWNSVSHIIFLYNVYAWILSWPACSVAVEVIPMLWDHLEGCLFFSELSLLGDINESGRGRVTVAVPSLTHIQSNWLCRKSKPYAISETLFCSQLWTSVRTQLHTWSPW